MRKSLLTLFRSLLIATLTAGALWSCQDEKPEIILPDPVDPVIPQKEFRYVESLTPDTVKFKTIREQDSVTFNIRTIPYDLLKRDSVTVQVADSAGARYEFADISSYTLGSDSVWNIKTYINKGVRSGDIISIMVAVGNDTVMYSDPMVLYLYPVEPRALESLAPDTLVFDRCDTTIIRIKTKPLNLLEMDSVKIAFIDSIGNVLDCARITSATLSDSIWNLVTHIRYPMQDGDIISLRVTDEDTVMFTGPMVIRILTEPEPEIIRYSISIASDSISGFLHGGQATIRVRTSPWKALSDTSFAIALYGTDGNTLDKKFSIADKVFEPEDSCWSIKVDVLDRKLDSERVSVRMACPDTVVSTKFVTVLKVALSMSYVRTGNELSFSFNNKTGVYSYCDPTGTDFSARPIKFGHNGEKITMGDSVLINGEYNIIDARKPFKVTIWKYDVHRDYTITMYNTGLPIVTIDTQNQTITRRDTWVPGITMRIVMPDGTLDYEGTLSMKGRGNQTWSDFKKKPYALKLDEKAKILGMHKQKRWILLANVKDRTLLRNDLAFWVSRQTEIPYTVSGQYVELVWNGKHIGNYYLCEQIRIDKHRIDIHDPNLEEPEKGGYFMRIDAFLGYSDPKWADKGKDLGFWSKRYNMPYIYKDPDEDENGNMLSKQSQAYLYMYNYVNDMETAISKASKTNHDWMNYLDAKTAVDFALIQELTMNHDAYNTWPKDGPKSTYLYKDSAGLMCFGPVWDFDYHTFTLYNDYENGGGSWTDTENPRIKQWEILNMSSKGGKKYYFPDLLKDPQFKQLLVERWQMYMPIWESGFDAYVDQMAQKIRLSEQYNEKLWGYPSKQNGDWWMTFDQAIAAVKEAFHKRVAWINSNINSL